MSQITYAETVEARIEASTDLMLPPATVEVTPFEIHVPQSALDDLKRRLNATRWPNRETVSDWLQGVPLARVRAVTSGPCTIIVSGICGALRTTRGTLSEETC